MTCKEIKQKFPDFLMGSLDESAKSAIEAHVASCHLCKEELESLTAMWTKLGLLPEEQPGKELRTRFYAMLESYKLGLQQAKPTGHWRKILDGWLERWAPRRPVFQFSLALVLLVVGLAVGYFLHANLQRVGEITQLRQEVQQLRQMAAVSLLQQESLNQQLREIGLSSRVEQPDAETLEAFLRSLDREAAKDLRPAGIDALYLLYNYPIVRQEYIQALSEQASPVVQIALALTQHIKSF